MSLQTKSLGTAALLAAALLAGPTVAAVSRPHSVDAAMKMCVSPGHTETQRMQCVFGAMAMHRIVMDAKSGQMGEINYNFSPKATGEERTAMADFSKAVDRCFAEGRKKGGFLTQCHMKAFNNYENALKR